MVNALTVAFPNQFAPTGFLWTHILSLPFKSSRITRWIWSFLNNLLFVLTSVLEFSILSQIIDLCGLLKVSCKLVKGRQRCIHGTVSTWGGLNLIPLQKACLLVFVLLNPKFVISFIQSFLRGNIMGAIVSWSWIGIAQMLRVLIEVNLFTNAHLFFLHLLFLSIQLLYGFLQAVSTYSRHFSILLVDLYFVEISVFAQFWVDFVFQ